MRYRRLIALTCAAAALCGVTLVHAAQLTLNWKDNASNETGFVIERKSGACRSSRAAWQVIARLPANVVGFVDEGLKAGATYCYRVSAFNAGGASAWTNSAQGVAKDSAAAHASRR